MPRRSAVPSSALSSRRWQIATGMRGHKQPAMERFLSRRARELVAAMTVLVFLSVVLPSVAEAVTTTPSGMWGGGFVNVVVADPNDPLNKMELAGDVSGFHRSTSGGTSWITSNEGMEIPNDRSVAALA